MDRTKWPAIGGTVVGTYLLSRHVPTTFAFDKPVHTSILLLASCATTVIALSRFLPKSGPRSHKGQQYDALPLEEVGQAHASRQSSPAPEDVRYPSSLRKLRIVFLVLVVAICLRVEFLREILANTQCTAYSWEPLLPLAFAIWDYRSVQRHVRRATDEDPGASVYDALEQYLVRTRYGYVFAAALVGLGGTFALYTTGSPTSSHICAASLPHHWQVPLLQHSGTLLDAAILYCIGQLLHQQDGRGARSVSLRFMSVAWALLVSLDPWNICMRADEIQFSAIVLLISGIVYYIVFEENRVWILSIPKLYFWSTLNLDLLACFTVTFALLAVSAVGP